MMKTLILHLASHQYVCRSLQVRHRLLSLFQRLARQHFHKSRKGLVSLEAKLPIRRLSRVRSMPRLLKTMPQPYQRRKTRMVQMLRSRQTSQSRLPRVLLSSQQKIPFTKESLE